MDKVNLAHKLSLFSECWSPKIVGQVNDFHVKLAKLHGEFVWHAHAAEDELFLVLKGRLRMRFRDREVLVDPGEFLIVPRQTEHCPPGDPTGPCEPPGRVTVACWSLRGFRRCRPPST